MQTLIYVLIMPPSGSLCCVVKTCLNTINGSIELKQHKIHIQRNICSYVDRF